MILNVDRFCSLSLATLVAALLVSQGSAALIGFNAEDGSSATTTVTATLGDHFDPPVAEAGALGGQNISIESNFDQEGGTSTTPGSAVRVASYDIDFAESGNYDLYARLRVDGADIGNNDSMFVGNGFGVKDPTAGGDWLRVNGRLETVAIGEYNWVNLTTSIGFDGAGVAYTVAAAGMETFQIGGREDGLSIDAFAFGTSGETFSDAQLDFAVTGVPEPASLALLLLGGMALAGIRR